MSSVLKSSIFPPLPTLYPEKDCILSVARICNRRVKVGPHEAQETNFDGEP